MGLLWPGMFDRFGDVIGLAFALEGIFFFLEAIFISIYIFGWRRLSPWAHFWSGVPIPLCGLGGAFMVLSANAWMNQPGGFEMDAAGKVTERRRLVGDLQRRRRLHVRPHVRGDVHLRRASWWRRSTPSGCCAGGATATTASASCCPSRSPRSRCRSRCSSATSSARAIYEDQPIKFAALELNTTTGSHKPEILLGHLNDDGTVSGGIEIPDLASWLSDPVQGADTVVTGLDSVPPEDRPTRAAHQHRPPGLGHDGRPRDGPDVARPLVRGALVAAPRRRSSTARGSCAPRRVAPIAAYLCLEAGWVVTEVGRQPWVVYEILRTEDAVTNASAGAGVDLVHRRSSCSTPRSPPPAVLVIRGDDAALARAATSTTSRPLRPAARRRRRSPTRRRRRERGRRLRRRPRGRGAALRPAGRARTSAPASGT